MSRKNIYRTIQVDNGEVLSEGTSLELSKLYGISQSYVRSSAKLGMPAKDKRGMKLQFEISGYYAGNKITHIRKDCLPKLPKLEKPKKRKVMSLREVDKASKKSGMSYGYFVARRGV